MNAIVTPYNTNDLDGPTETSYTFHLDLNQGRPFCICVVDYKTQEECTEAIKKHFPDASIIITPVKTVIIK